MTDEELFAFETYRLEMISIHKYFPDQTDPSWLETIDSFTVVKDTIELNQWLIEKKLKPKYKVKIDDYKAFVKVHAEQILRSPITNLKAIVIKNSIANL